MRIQHRVWMVLVNNRFTDASRWHPCCEVSSGRAWTLLAPTRRIIRLIRRAGLPVLAAREAASTRQQRADALDRTGNVFLGVGVGEADVALAMNAEAGAGDRGDACLLQHTVLKFLGGHAGA